MSQYESVTDIDEIAAPWSRTVTLQHLVYVGGMPMLRVRIKERRRFTDLELTPEVAADIGRQLVAWAAEHDPNAE